MKKEKSTNTAIRITPSEKEYLEKRAKEMGTTFTDLLKEGAKMLADFDPWLLGGLKGFASDLKMDEAIVIQNMLIKRLAMDAARWEVYGPGGQEILNEFMFTDGRIITGKELFEILKSTFVCQLKTKMENSEQYKISQAVEEHLRKSEKKVQP